MGRGGCEALWRKRGWPAALGLALVVILPASAGAQTETTSFATERFRLATDGEGVLDVEAGEVSAHLGLDVALWLGYQDDPLLLRLDGERSGALVGSRFGGEAVVTLGLFDLASVAVALPFALTQGRDATNPAVVGTLSDLGGGLGDVRIVPKLRILRQRDAGVALALIPALTFPGDGQSRYLGEREVSFAPEIALSRRFGAFRAALNLGYRQRPVTGFLGLAVSDELLARLGLAFDLAPATKVPLELAVTGSGATRAAAPFERSGETAAEVLFGATFRALTRLSLFGAMGIGLAEGFGTPDVRGLLGLRWGLGGRAPDRAAVAPIPAVDIEDTDRDGVSDADDLCPQRPGLATLAGCPDDDADGDGIRLSSDTCPEQAEDEDGFQDQDGCPEPDDDEDGLLDADDRCPREAGPARNLGCPEPDRDGDGVVDREDNCPDTVGLAAQSGCTTPQRVHIQDSLLSLDATVDFATGSARLTRNAEKLLDEVAQVLAVHPEILRIRIEGHTDGRGSAARNARLSTARARAVQRYLTKAGVDGERLEAKGYGATQPIADDGTPQGRTLNRRVVLVVVKRRVRGP